MVKRGITGILFVGVIVTSIRWYPDSFSILFSFLTAAGMWEFYGLAEKDDVKPLKAPGIIAGVLLFLSNTSLFSFLFPIEIQLALATAVSFLVFAFELFRKSAKPFTNIAFTLLGIIYIALPLSLLNHLTTPLYEYDYDPWILLGYLIILWTYDTFAYFSGMIFGKHRLFERVSPNKTWEGVLGGSLASFIAAVFISGFSHEIALYGWMIMAAVIIVTGTLGDLVQSLLKRSLNIKDSGKILPGHGGILDRIDAMLISAPFVYLLYVLLENDLL